MVVFLMQGYQSSGKQVSHWGGCSTYASITSTCAQHWFPASPAACRHTYTDASLQPAWHMRSLADPRSCTAHFDSLHHASAVLLHGGRQPRTSQQSRMNASALSRLVQPMQLAWLGMPSSCQKDATCQHAL